MRRYLTIAAVLTLGAFGFRLYLSFHLPPDDDDDGKFYSQIARNLLDHRGYSGEEEEPFVPTYVRAPGYPLFLAGVYYAFGQGNERAVRVIQATADTVTCWLVALLALAWSPTEWNPKKRRRAMLIALALAAACPFTAVYVTTMLTETWATLLASALALVATLALRSERSTRAGFLWLAAGLLGGTATMFRPDCALFVGGAGVMLVGAGLFSTFASSMLLARSAPHARSNSLNAALVMILSCIALSIGFSLALAPWTIRNARVFGVFQPVAPQYANMPYEFVPFGYVTWLRTWVDDERYVRPFEEAIDLYPIRTEGMPDYAFDSPEERDVVAGLLERYDNPAKPEPSPETDDDDDAESTPPVLTVKMTPEIDAEFRQIADERIARHPIRYYVGLPLKRAAALWFDTHSQYYPFQGQLFPWSNLDRSAHQQYWLPLFAFLTALYTVIALVGGWIMWITRSSRQWVLLLGLLILPRLAFLATQEHPEPRYTVEFFAFAAVAGGIALASLKFLQRLTRDPGDQSSATTPAGDV